MKRSILASIRTGKTFKYISAFVALSIITQCISPTVAFALTSGPGQEEFASFEPATTTDMVDLYSGDFNYNIPLLSVPGPNGGYPINLAYHSGIGMEQEGSWVGLGWNINVGAINRQLRGLPDDFNGEEVKQKMNLKKNTTVMLDYSPAMKKEFYGMPKGDKGDIMSFQMYYNTYKGLGTRVFANVSRETKNGVAGVGLGISYDSQDGFGLEPSMSLSAQHNKSSLSFTAGASYNSRQGLQSFSFSSSLKSTEGTGNKVKNEKGEKVDEMMDYRTTSNLSFSTGQSVPTVSIPMRTETYPFDIKIARPSPPWDRGYFKFQTPLAWTGSVANSKVANNGVVKTKAYGYLYTDGASGEDMRDFNRAPINYSKKIPNLAPSSFTYDLYTQTGQGAGGMFRPYYSSIGILSSPTIKSVDVQRRINLEAGFGVDAILTPPSTDYHIGAGYTQINGSSTSGSWKENDEELKNALGFGSDLANDKGYESFYFKQYGEKSGVLLSADQLAEKWGGDQAIRVKLEKEGGWGDRHFTAKNAFIRNQPEAWNTLVSAGHDQRFRKQRQARASNVEILTDQQALLYGGKEAQYGYNGITPNKTFDHNDKISEISILQSDGMRYTYGLPAYNKTQTEAVFSVNGSGLPENAGNVPIVPNNGTDITPSTHQGSDEYLSQTTMDTPYAHSWLLTSVVSADYIDLTGDGPTADDYGYWVKFNYLKTATNYKWRIPYSGANYIEGNWDEHSDDKASFSYGEKEIYFLSSVETKTHIAFFELFPRWDAVQANGKYAIKVDDADALNNPMKGLRTIKLFAKDPATGHYFVPIKTVNFGYDYKLCQGTENSAPDRESRRAKLTLTNVSFTYQNSERGQLSAYKFKYGDAVDNTPTITNPVYNIEHMDRWGNYKNNSGQNKYPYKEFPYTEQKENAPPDVSKWSLTQIDLPTGGTIKINYESDDYGYEETKKATHMFEIMGIGAVPSVIPQRADDNPILMPTERHHAQDNGNFRVYFRLDKNIATLPDDAARLAYVEHHVRDINKIYFKIKAQLTPGKFDYVTGYADVAGTGEGNIGWETITTAAPVKTEMVGFVTLQGVNLKKNAIVDKTVNPFTKAAIQHLRVNRSELVFDSDQQVGSDNFVNEILGLLGAVSIGTTFNDIMSMIRGFNTWAYANSFGHTIQLSGRSVMRLNDPDGIKYGGGVRVAKIAISDNWDVTNQEVSPTSTGAREYGQKYDYRILENGELISSGVAYEPQVGREESALRTPIEYEESEPLGTTSNLFLDNPILEEYYPGASVGYRKVTVTSLAQEQAKAVDNSLTIEHSATPITIYEFYSPKDFPVIADETDINSDPAIIRPILIPGIYSSFKKRMARSQGYSVVINDMAGKMKSVTQRTRPTTNNPDGALISKEEYIYNTVSTYDENKTNRLSNQVQVLAVNPSSHEITYQTAMIGQSHDVFLDENENRQESKGYGLDLNFDVNILTTTPYTPTFVLVPLPYASESQTSMRTIVTMKVISRSAILKKVITTHEESVITKENLAFDLETGKPLLTKVTNEFKDPVYQFAYPAHWYYENMGGAYKNYGFELKALTASPSVANEGKVALPGTTGNYFTPGDELWVNNSFKAHVYKVNTTGSNYICLIKREGGYVNGSVTEVKIITSGRKNLLDAEAGKLLSQELQSTSTTYSFNKIVDASAVEYKNEWDAICDRCGYVVPTAANMPKDPYTNGEAGIWRPYRSYVYKTDRSYNDDKSRTSGIYVNFTPFKWYDIVSNDPKWIAANTMDKYSPYGFELQNKDAIGNYSGALYGYGQSIPTAIAKNAQFKELIFDGFEDYRNGNCTDHQFVPYQDKIADTEKHTGRYSIRVKPGEKIEIESTMKDCRH